jgi:hypothetical protein
MSRVGEQWDRGGDSVRFSWSFETGLSPKINGKTAVRGQAKRVLTPVRPIDTVLYVWVGGAQTLSLRNSMVQWEFTVGLFFRL